MLRKKKEGLVQNRKSLKIKAELFEDKQKNFFLCLGTSKTLSLGEFDESKIHQILNSFFMHI